MIERRAFGVLSAIAVAELIPIVPPLFGVRWGFIGLQNLPRHPGTATAWVLAAIVAWVYVATSIRTMPGLRERLGTMGALRIVAVVLAIAAGITEEVVFRKAVMDGLAHAGFGAPAQVGASALAFGAVHGIWGLFGGARVARGAILWTSGLGAALAVVYLVGGRALLPCIGAHAAIDLVLEPGLIMAAFSARRRVR